MYYRHNHSAFLQAIGGLDGCIGYTCLEQKDIIFNFAYENHCFEQIKHCFPSKIKIKKQNKTWFCNLFPFTSIYATRGLRKRNGFYIARLA